MSVEEGDLRVWWIPQVPGAPFYVPVSDVEQAILIVNTLGRYDAFQYENRIKPDYCNVGGLEVYEDGEWLEWMDDNDDEIWEIIRNEASNILNAA